jgi:hypothetical protein
MLMRSWKKSLVLAAAICAISGSYALAGGRGGHHHGGHHGGKGVPGPIAGAGLPFLLIAGGYALVRRRRNRAEANQHNVAA